MITATNGSRRCREQIETLTGVRLDDCQKIMHYI